MSANAVIACVGAVCAVGNGIRQVDASVRAGLGAQAKSSVRNRRFEPIRMALVPETAIEPLDAANERLGWTSSLRRMLRLGGPALREAIAPLPPGSTVQLFVGLPEPGPRSTPANPVEFSRALLAQSKASISVDHVSSFPAGRASALLALEASVKALGEGRCEWALVGGIDTYLDLARLCALDAEARLLGGSVMDGFIPGEGAAFVLLTTASLADRHGIETAAAVCGTGVAVDPGHRYSHEPSRGEGLSGALDALARNALAFEPIKRTYAGLNGENFGAKEWGVARIRHSPRFARAAPIEHPADCYGDVGAATGTLLLALAERSLRRTDHSPVLVWSSSDGEARACALLSSRRRTRGENHG